MVITYNKAYNNNHGIICSVMCYNIRIENNELYNNKRDGIFLDAGSHHVTIANNKIYNEDEIHFHLFHILKYTGILSQTQTMVL